MKISGIYKIQSIIRPERIYVGSAVYIKKRWNRHLQDLDKKCHHSTKLQRHYNKYGSPDLIFTIIETCPSNILITREQFYINTLNPYFNICKIAGSTLGLIPSEETKRKIREKNSGERCFWFGKTHTEESKNKIGVASSLRNKGENNPNFGKHSSEETKSKISEANKNPSEETRNKMRKSGKIKIFTDEHRRNLQLGHTGKYQSEETKQKKRESMIANWQKRKQIA